MKITLKDIAEDTGLSISTVSRALKGTGQISSENQKKIFESAQKLNYPLNNNQTPLNLKKSLYIAVITHFHTGEFYASFYNGFDKAASGSNIFYGLYNVENKDTDIVELIKDLRRDRFDATVLFLPSLDAQDYERLIENIPLDFPLVSTAPITTPVMDTITFDNYRGGHLVAKHFVERGYKDLGIITGPTSKNEALLRKNGFYDYIKTIPDTNIIWEFEGDYTNESGYRAFSSYESLEKRPRAVFVCNDGMAFSFMQKAQVEGYSIPDDIAVAGYDDLPNCQFFHPSLTSVRTDYVALGKYVTDLLMKQLKEKNPHRGYLNLIPVSLAIRSSS